MLDVGRIQRHNNLAGFGKPVMETKKQNSVGYRGYAGFLGVELTLKALKHLSDANLAFKQILFIIVDEDKVIHVPDVMLDAQFFLDEVIQGVQDADAGDLDHLAAGIETDLMVILTIQNTDCLLIRPSVDDLVKTILHNLVRHVRVVALNITLEHITLRAVLPVEPLQEAFQSFSRQIWPFLLLTGHIVIDKASADFWIQDVVIQASLKHTIPEVHADNVAFLRIINLEFLWFLLLVLSILKLAFKRQVLFNVVQIVVRRRILPKHAFDAFQRALAQRLKACNSFKVVGIFL